MEFDPRHRHKVRRAVTHQTKKVLGKIRGFCSIIFSKSRKNNEIQKPDPSIRANAELGSTFATLYLIRFHIERFGNTLHR
jgi:uncharacterized protein (DUF924 family)